MPTKETVSENESKMKKAFDVLVSDLKSVRTGMASTGLVENIGIMTILRRFRCKLLMWKE